MAYETGQAHFTSLSSKNKSCIVQIADMADTQLPVPFFPVTLPPPLSGRMSGPKNSGRKPFSSVAPARILQVSRLQIQLRLETIHEEESGDIDEDETYTSSAPFSAFLSSQTVCFLEIIKSSSSFETQLPVCLGN